MTTEYQIMKPKDPLGPQRCPGTKETKSVTKMREKECPCFERTVLIFLTLWSLALLVLLMSANQIVEGVILSVGGGSS